MEKIEDKKNKIGIAFGGGGAKGFAHLGAIKAFEENGIEFDEVSGTSVGSMIGCLYSAGLTSDEIMQKAKNLKNKDILGVNFLLFNNSTEGVEKLIKSFVGDIEFSDLKKPFTAVAVDINTGKELHISSGNVAKAVAGSCAVPVVFNPVMFGKHRLVDGGVTNNLPADVLRYNHCKYVVSIDVNPKSGYGTKSVKTTSILGASLKLLVKSNSVRAKLFSDVMIEIDTHKYKVAKIEKAEELFKLGYDAVMQAMPKIKKLFEKRNSSEYSTQKTYKVNKKRILEDEDILKI